MKAIVDNKPVQKFHLILAVGTLAVFAFAEVAVAMPEVEQVVAVLQEIVEDNPGTVLTAHYELTKSPPDYQAAVGNMEGAVGDIQAAVEDGLLDAEQGAELMDLLSCAAWQLAVGAICQAIDCEADADKIAEAEQALGEGEQLWLDGAYKDAVAMYKDALAKAEGALSGPIDPLAELITQTLVKEDDQEVGKALLCYDENANETCIRLKCWGLEAQTEYTVLLCEVDDDGNVTDYIELGGVTTNDRGKGHLHACVGGDPSLWGVAIGFETDVGLTLCAIRGDLEAAPKLGGDVWRGYFPP
jgi:hypothetical protein